MTNPIGRRFANAWGIVRALAVPVLLASCAATPTSERIAEGPALTPIRGEQDPEVAERLAQAKREILSGGQSVVAYRNAASTIRNDLRTSPAAAAFYVDDAIGQRAYLGKSAYLADRKVALETLISGGRGDLLPDYWQQVHADSPFFSEPWAVSAMTWYAEYEPTSAAGGYSQRELAQYWSLGCLTRTWNMENDVNIVNIVLQPVTGRRCEPDANRTGRYLSLYVKGGRGPSQSSDRIAQAIELASDLGRRHLQTKNLGAAAGWYAVVLGLDAQAPEAFSATEASELFRQLYRPGWTFRVDGQVVTVGQMRFDAMRMAQSRNQGRVIEAANKLRMIQDAGVTTIAPF